MSGVVGRFRSFRRALSIDSDNENEDNHDSSSLIGKSVNFLSKHSHSNQPVINTPSQQQRDVKYKILLVIDDHENHWKRFFKGHTLDIGDTVYDIRVEQATFNELQVNSSSEKGASVSMKVVRNGSVVARSFKPDFLLVREYIQGPDRLSNYKSLLLGLMHGLVPSVNSLTSAYNFLDKPVIYAELLKIQQRLGSEKFPLIQQNFYQSHNEMLLPPALPVVVKVGSANSGYGKVCVASARGFQDVASLVAMTDNYACSEPFLEGKFDLRIQKIGQRYKVFKRKSLSESWKTNTGASAVEEIALTERYKTWVDECSCLFGGLDIICVEAIHTIDDREFIVEVNNICSSICPDKKEDDMKSITNVVLRRMEENLLNQSDIYHAPSPVMGNSLTDAIQLISGPPSPCNGSLHQQNRLDIINLKHRPESAPLNERSTIGNTYQKTNGVMSSTCSLNETEKQPTNRKSSLSGRFFSALND